MTKLEDFVGSELSEDFCAFLDKLVANGGPDVKEDVGRAQAENATRCIWHGGCLYCQTSRGSWYLVACNA